MDFELTKSQTEIQRAARDFAKGEFDPKLALELDRKHEYPKKYGKKQVNWDLSASIFPKNIPDKGWVFWKIS